MRMRFTYNLGTWFKLLAVGVLSASPGYFLCGCSSITVYPGDSAGELSHKESGAREGLSGRKMQRVESLHFVVRGYNFSKIAEIARTCEDIYQKVMFDTNLLSFKPKENYSVTVYSTREEFHQITGFPSWSGGGARTKLLGNLRSEERDLRALTSIVTHEEALTTPLLAHEITHLVFNEFMEFYTAEDADRCRWLNEGLASYEELEANPPATRDEFLGVVEPLLREHALPVGEVLDFNPFRQPLVTLGTYFFQGRRFLFTNVDVWYWQCRSLTEFLIEKHGRYNFYLFMNALKVRKDVFVALQEGYPGRWRNLTDLENEWKGNWGHEN